MAVARHPIIAIEGRLSLFICAALAMACYWITPALAVFFAITYLFLLILFRDPHRAIPPVPLGLVSPADGVIESIETKVKSVHGLDRSCLI